MVIRGDPGHVARRLADRFAGFADRVALSTPGGITETDLAAVAAGVRDAGTHRRRDEDP